MSQISAMQPDTTLSEYQQDFDFAVLDLKARRFEDAHAKYEELIRYTNHYSAWCGLGISKAGFLHTGEHTVEEIEYCFKRAKELQKEATIEIDHLYAKSVCEILYAFIDVYKRNLINANNQDLEIAKGIGIALLGGYTMSTNQTTTGKLMGLGLTGIASFTVADAIDEKRSFEKYNKLLLETSRDLISSYRRFITNQDDFIVNANKLIKKCQHELNKIIYLESNPEEKKRRKAQQKIDESKSVKSIEFEGDNQDVFKICHSVGDRIGFIQTLDANNQILHLQLKDFFRLATDVEVRVKQKQANRQQILIIAKSSVGKNQADEESTRLMNCIKNYNNPKWIMSKSGKSTAYVLKFWAILLLILSFIVYRISTE